MQLTLTHVSFSYDGSPIAALGPVTVTLPVGWTGIVGANGRGKTTLLRLVAGDLSPLEGTIHRPADAVYCAQPTDAPPALLDDFALDWGSDAGRLRSVLGIGDEWPWRFDTLSHGERKRLQLAVALWCRPHVLAVDEPTNHLDERARALVIEALHDFQGIGLIVSHDRALLDGLAGQCLFLGEASAVLRPGSYSEGRAQAEIEAHSAEHEREAAKRVLRQVADEAARRRGEADRAHALRSRGRVDAKDRDAKCRIGQAIFTGKDGQAGRLSAQLEGRLSRAQARLDAAHVEKTLGGGGIWVPTGRSKRATVAVVAAGSIPLGPSRSLVTSELLVGPTDHIVITGPNGVGKSTLLRALLGGARVESSRVLYIPQEVASAQVAQLIRDLRSMPDALRGQVLSIVARLGSDPTRLLAGDVLSPGEVRKLMLAIGVVGEPHLLAMDEPTNHLDLPAIEALEDALAVCPCALVLVSHDRRFVDRVASVRWRLSWASGGDTTIEVR